MVAESGVLGSSAQHDKRMRATRDPRIVIIRQKARAGA